MYIPYSQKKEEKRKLKKFKKFSEVIFRVFFSPMTTLEDTFLEDFEGDSEDDFDVSLLGATNQINENVKLSKKARTSNNNDIDDNDVNENEEIELFEDMEDIIDIDTMEKEDKPLLMTAPSVETISDLLNNEHLIKHLECIENEMNNSNNNHNNNNTFELIHKSNEYIMEIDNHIFRIHKFMRDIYATKFPELEEMVIHPIEYAKCIKTIANKKAEEMSELPLRKILSNPSVAMMVLVTATTTSGKQLQEIDLQRVLHACDIMLELDEKKQIILNYIISRMTLIAPNVSQLLGCEITAKLITLVGGIKKLSQMPSCNIQILGNNKNHIVNIPSFSSAISNSATVSTMPSHTISSSGYHTSSNVDPHFGIISQCSLMTNCPKNLQTKAIRLIAAKVVLCARIDANSNFNNYRNLNNNKLSNSKFLQSIQMNNDGNFNEGLEGKRYYEDCFKKIAKWQEPPPPKPLRPLSMPDHKPKKKRGGKRYRKMRDRYKVTETQRMQNRVSFNKQEEEVIDGNGEIVGLGMLGSAADVGGRLRVIQSTTQTTTLYKLHRRQIIKQKKLRMKAEKAGTISGLHTSFILTSSQGLELGNPELVKQKSSVNQNVTTNISNYNNSNSNNNVTNNNNNNNNTVDDNDNRYFDDNDIFAKQSHL